MTVFRPTSIAEAVSNLSDHPDVRVVAGGTDVMVALGAGTLRLAHVMSVRVIPELRSWAHDPASATVRIGAARTFAALAVGTLGTLAPALAQAARAFGSAQIQNAATIGGSVGSRAANGDALVVLTALDATIELASQAGRRAVTCADFATGAPDAGLRSDELITAISVPVHAQAQQFAKVTPRAAVAAAVVNAAVVVDHDRRRVRIALGGVAPTVVRAGAAETWCAAALDWDHVVADPEQARELGRRVAASIAPVDDDRATGAYRRHAAGVLAARLLLRCLA
jgi:CO/xanthine dehydrogenase FAD-binding subunit